MKEKDELKKRYVYYEFNGSVLGEKITYLKWNMEEMSVEAWDRNTLRFRFTALIEAPLLPAIWYPTMKQWLDAEKALRAKYK